MQTRADLVKDLESVADGQQRDLSAIITLAKSPGVPRERLVSELKKNRLGFFATKILKGGYQL